ncbi:DHH family phosphoesterase [Acidithiobacillus sp. IBUN Pt1247-S3]|uniref:single-stranded-DNA-specific exonuclease RecJ n=1 Tax=Acidithiobacillus sp. IBUN Pt1247-S3 TaxID=3166642 RepID=UPI0034E48091
MQRSEICTRRVAHEVENAALELGYSHLQARLIAGRLGAEHAGQLTHLLRAGVAQINPPDLLPDIDLAVQATVGALRRQEPILLISDFDADGASAHAVLKIAFRDHFGVPEERIHSYIGHRLRDGYGVSENLTDRILTNAPRPALVITADQGSTDHARIARLRDANFTVIVTDHHGVPEVGPPPAAVACVNPVRRDSRFPDPFIAGVHVAWLYCCAVRQGMQRAGLLATDAPKLGHLLDLVALGTVADCVDLARSPNNRAIVARGLRLMNGPRRRPVWTALMALARGGAQIDAATLAFRFAPLINARGRLDSAEDSVRLFLSETLPEAETLAAVLQEDNEARKSVQAQMLRGAQAQVQEQLRAGRAALCIFDPEGHAGVQGICASKLVEATGRPVAFFSPKDDPEFVSASLRTVGSFHVRDALAAIAVDHPEDFVAWGGHAGAGGVTLRRSALERFSVAWAELAMAHFASERLGPRIWTDGVLTSLPSLELLAEIAELEPFGRQWEAPLFVGEGEVTSLRPVGDGRHLKLALRMPGADFDAIWFFASEDGVSPIQTGQSIRFAYALERNDWRGESRLQLQIRHAEPCAT